MFSLPSLLTRWSALILQVGVSHWWQSKSCSQYYNKMAKKKYTHVHGLPYGLLGCSTILLSCNTYV